MAAWPSTGWCCRRLVAGPLTFHVTWPVGAGALAGTETVAVKVAACP